MSESKPVAAPIASSDVDLFKRIESMAGWDIASHYGCDYSGNINVIPHGGYFYDLRDWERYGYARIVEFMVLDGPDDDEPQLWVECGTVNRLKGKELTSAMDCIGNPDIDDDSRIHVEIDACKSYAGFDRDECGTRTFKLANWPQEWRIWRQVNGHLINLGA